MKVAVFIIQEINFDNLRYIIEIILTYIFKYINTHLIVPHIIVWPLFALKRSWVVQDGAVEEGRLHVDSEAPRRIIQDLHSGRRVMGDGRTIPQVIDAVPQQLLVQSRPLT